MFVDFTGVHAEEHMGSGTGMGAFRERFPQTQQPRSPDLGPGRDQGTPSFPHRCSSAPHRQPVSRRLVRGGRRTRPLWTSQFRRAAMPLQDLDPFGDQFFEFFTEWQSSGSPTTASPAARNIKRQTSRVNCRCRRRRAELPIGELGL